MKCRACKQPFTKLRPLQVACGWECAAQLAQAKRERDEAKQARAERVRTAEAKQALKTRRDWINDAQEAFNKFIRTRDVGKPCICCGLPLGNGEVGGAYDCGHYRSVGSAPHLRFNEANAHAQRKRCNRYGAGRAVDYRLGLIARIGLQQVEALEGDNSSAKWSIEELKQLVKTYRAKTRELEKQHAGML